MSIVVIALAAIVILFIVLTMRERKMKRIPRNETIGVVEKVTVPLGKAEEVTYYISFRVGDNAYHGIVGEAGAEYLDRNTQVGTEVTVFYNPENPKDFYCRRIFQ